MNILVLTQQSGILKPFAIFLGYIMDYIYRFLEMLGITNVALTIVLLTVVVNIILIPITVKQQKFSRMSAIMNPEIQKIQKKYKNKKDEQSMRLMQAETSAIYDKYGASPMGGCLPSLIQVPILFALYRVIYNVPAYVRPVREVYEKIAQPIMSADTNGSIMTKLIKDLSLKITDFDITNVNKVIDTLNVVKSSGWTTLSSAFSGHADVVSAISKYSTQIINMNWLPGGLSISDAPINFGGGLAGWFPGVLIPILAGLTQWINIRVTQTNQPGMDDGSQTANTMKTMNTMMPLMSVFFCTTLPSGMGVYWISSAGIRTVITMIINKFLKNMDIDVIIEANKEKAAKKAEKRGEKQKKLDEYASMNTRSISSIAGGNVNHGDAKRSGVGTDTYQEKKKPSAGSSANSSGANSSGAANKSGGTNSSSGANASGKKKASSDNKNTKGSSSEGSISDIANMFKNRD